MLKAAALTIAAIAVFFVLTGAIVLGAHSLVIPVSYKEQQDCAASAKAEHNAHPNCPKTETMLDRTLADPVAFYTFGLTLFTLALALGAAFQGGLIWRQISLAREEFAAGHRAKMRIRLVMVGKLKADEPLKISFVVANVGDTEATDIRAKVAIQIAGDKSAIWEEEFSIADSVAPGEPIQVKRTTTLECKPEWAVKHWGDGGRVRIHGFIAYSDARNIGRRTGFYRYSSGDLHRFRLPDDKDIERDYEYED